jgi:hypothetical protein
MPIIAFDSKVLSRLKMQQQPAAVDVAFLAYLTITIEFCPTLFRKPNVHLVNKFLASLATLSPRSRALGCLG